MSEANEMRVMMVELGKELPQTRVFRNNTGQAWQGKVRRNPDGSITLYDPRVIHVGLCKGGSDLIGITTITITPDMVGKKVGLFTAFENKTVKGKASEEQETFLNFVKTKGGIASVVRNSQEAVDAVNTHNLPDGL